MSEFFSDLEEKRSAWLAPRARLFDDNMDKIRHTLCAGPILLDDASKILESQTTSLRFFPIIQQNPSPS